MGPTWALSAPDGPHVGPMNLAIRDHTNLTAPETSLHMRHAQEGNADEIDFDWKNVFVFGIHYSM